MSPVCSVRWTAAVQRPRLRSTVRESPKPSGSFYSGPPLRTAHAGGRKVRAHRTRSTSSLHVCFTSEWILYSSPLVIHMLECHRQEKRPVVPAVAHLGDVCFILCHEQNLASFQPDIPANFREQRLKGFHPRRESYLTRQGLSQIGLCV